MSSPTDPIAAFRTERHQFILQYYSMAVQDLTRHFGVGWQTITSIIGTVAVISLAQDKKLPAQFAVSAAIAVAFWAILNITEASYWATRAIAFLANVEAVYFYESERRIFNPYVGSHPPLKGLAGLRYQLNAAIVMLVLSCVYYLKQVSDGTAHFSMLSEKIANHGRFDVFYWALPAFVFCIMLDRTVAAKHKRIRDYRDFVTSCPGPGLVRDLNVNRGMNLSLELQDSQLLPGADIQKDLGKTLVASERRFLWIKRTVTVLCWLLIGVMFVLIGLKTLFF
jgi:hypothetical protein